MTQIPLCALRVALAGLAACGAVGSAHAATNLITNGSFESISQKAGTWNIYSSLAGWQVGSNGVEIRNNVDGAAFDGANFVELDTTKNSWISQSFATVAGQSYEVSFYYSPRMQVPLNSNDIIVSLNDVTKLTAVGSGQHATGNVWKEYSFDFVASSASSKLTFAAGGVSNSFGGSLDKVSVTAVPEPASWATMVAGLLGLGVIARRRRR